MFGSYTVGFFRNSGLVLRRLRLFGRSSAPPFGWAGTSTRLFESCSRTNGSSDGEVCLPFRPSRASSEPGVGPVSYRPNRPIVLRRDVSLSLTKPASRGEGVAGRRGPRSGGDQELCALAVLRLSPRPTLELQAQNTPFDLWGSEPMGRDFFLTWPPGDEGRFYATKMGRTPGEEAATSELLLHPSRQPLLVRGGSDGSARQIRFHVLNFPVFSGRGDEIRQTKDGGSARHGRVRADAGAWRIELRGSNNLSRIVEELDRNRGFAPTHEGRIVRTDGEPIATNEARLLLRALDDFLSFARGACCSLTIVKAMSDDGGVVWEQWGCRRVDPWRRFCSSWFDVHHSHTLGEAFPGFLSAYSGSRDERRALHEAIYWYLRSDTRQSGVDGGLILMQAALERLAHTFHRRRRKREDTFAWLRGALTSRGIPVGIPAGSESLVAYADSVGGQGAVKDAVFAMTKLRNHAVHPRKDVCVPDGAYFQAWQLARWFVELTVLSVIGYKGTYANRLTREFEGQVEVVPWAGSCANT